MNDRLFLVRGTRYYLDGGNTKSRLEYRLVQAPDEILASAKFRDHFKYNGDDPIEKVEVLPMIE